MAFTPSYWEVSALHHKYDLIVIGGGIVGLSAAYYYKSAHPESSVMVIDKGFYPEGASTRNAGFACFGSVTEIQDDLKGESEEDVKKRIKARFDGLHKMRSVLGDEQIEYNPCGGYEIFENREAFDKAAVDIDRFNGWHKELINEDEVYSACVVNGYPAIRNRLEGAIHTGLMMKTLLTKVEQSDVEIKWNCPVKKVTDNRLIINESVTLYSEKILIAANGFTRLLLPDLNISPARGYVMVTNELKNCQWKGTYHYDKGFVYFRNIGNRILLGGARNLDKKTEESSAFEVNPKIKKWLVNFANETLKLEYGWQAEYEWTGIMGFADTKSPILKKIDDHIWVAAGLGGMGVAIGMQIGSDASIMLQ
jgi:gamma-glutamylputrescine oxidase